MSERKECEHVYCNEEFPPSPSTKKYCTRECKGKAKNYNRYNEDKAFQEHKKNASMVSYQKNKRSRYKRPGELTEADLEHLKTIKPEWFESE